MGFILRGSPNQQAFSQQIINFRRCKGPKNLPQNPMVQNCPNESSLDLEIRLPRFWTKPHLDSFWSHLIYTCI